MAGGRPPRRRPKFAARPCVVAWPRVSAGPIGARGRLEVCLRTRLIAGWWRAAGLSAVAGWPAGLAGCPVAACGAWPPGPTLALGVAVLLPPRRPRGLALAWLACAVVAASEWCLADLLQGLAARYNCR